jgi:putative transposase
VSEIYPAAQRIVDDGVASEREVCQFLDIARTPFQRWKEFELSPMEEDDMKLQPLVVSIFRQHKRRYGTRRIVDQLRDGGHSLGRRRVAKLMEKAGLKAIQPKSFKPKTTDSRHRLGYNENLILDLKEVNGPNRLWVADISYVPVVSLPYAYLAVLMDRFSRMIVGWQLRTDMTDQLVIEAFQQAIKTRRPTPGLIHHSDRGGQYASKRYRSIIRRAQIKQSMSRANECYDNAFMESCFGTIKNELEMTEYKNYRLARAEIDDYIRYYNTQRKHSAINYQTPSQFEKSVNLT